MPRYVLEPISKDRPKPLKITLSMEQYFGAMLPTLKVEGISVLHFLEDGRIALRDNLTSEDYKFLRDQGMRVFDLKAEADKDIRRSVEFINASRLGSF